MRDTAPIVTSIKPARCRLCSNEPMSPALHEVARLIECPRARPGLAARLSDALADETELPIATRLRLVALAVRLEAGERCDCSSRDGSEADTWVAALAQALLRDDEGTLEALIAYAPRLREVVARAGNSACRLPAAALLAVLGRKMH
ncbi:MAG: hypothetical protein LT106_00155 [Burkholderiaceae bacterium]|nr:hypothetical protein [Burkholderiaceae bacterium]